MCGWNGYNSNRTLPSGLALLLLLLLFDFNRSRNENSAQIHARIYVIYVQMRACVRERSRMKQAGRQKRLKYEKRTQILFIFLGNAFHFVCAHSSCISFWHYCMTAFIASKHSFLWLFSLTQIFFGVSLYSMVCACVRFSLFHLLAYLLVCLFVYSLARASSHQFLHGLCVLEHLLCIYAILMK